MDQSSSEVLHLSISAKANWIDSSEMIDEMSKEFTLIYFHYFFFIVIQSAIIAYSLNLDLTLWTFIHLFGFYYDFKWANNNMFFSLHFKPYISVAQYNRDHSLNLSKKTILLLYLILYTCILIFP